MSRIEITRWHEFDAGHRVVGHEGKCANLHGHRYRVELTVSARWLDDIGRVIDFAVIKDRMGAWLDANWDHHMLLWYDDPWLHTLEQAARVLDDPDVMPTGIARVPFNPTAENMARDLLTGAMPMVFGDLIAQGLRIESVRVDETPKCAAIARAE